MTDNTSAQPQQDPIQNFEQRMAQITPQIEQFRKDLESVQGVKGTIESLKNEINQSYEESKSGLSSIVEAKTTFETLKKQAQTQHNGLNTKLESLTAQIQETENTKGKLDNVLTEIITIKEQAEQNKDSVNSDVQAVNQIKSDFESLRNQAQALHTDLQGRQTDAQTKIAEIYDLNTKISELHDDLLVDDRDESNNVTNRCVSTQVYDLFEEMKNLIEEMKKDRETLKAENTKLKADLEKEIRSLLPEAGAAGLSSAYVQSKSKYGYIPYDGDFISWGNVRHFIKSHVPTISYYAMFIAPLGVMIWLFVDLFKDLQSNDINEKVMIFRVLIALPLAVISLFGWSSIRLSRRLYEEYNHKQRVMQLYHSFKSEIDNEGTEDHKKALLSIMLKAVDDKPSLVMKGIDDLWPSINLSGLLPFFAKKD
ncbi:MAG: hypothetical protein RBR86_08165 [Pseudobdellovibrionaceae bacterium]|jgi:hypothetical protein|nr:hypothetical protein [Pseudobdellovibrionaceae bacterium]